ncbi:MAG: biotin--[acetyl-CoA-carboxylase] ligase [Eubacterium sp.]|nr:biotin--[acetyl-CoA-carboxylase] ligase [Eubacterium sp.]
MTQSDFNYLTESGLLSRVHYYDVIGSTNDQAKKEVRKDNFIYFGPELFTADTQSSGRGRMGRVWTSPASTNISMSLVTSPKLNSEHISGITILAAMAVLKAVSDYSNNHGLSKLSDNLRIKWPNDLIIKGKKICGILTELVYPYVICGIGVNVNTPSFPQDISHKATSLLLETGISSDRTQIIGLISKYLINYINEYEKTEDLSFIIEEYNSLLISKDKEVILTSSNINVSSSSLESLNKHAGTTSLESPNKDSSTAFLNTLSEKFISRGIDKTGALLVEDKTGNIISISSGEVSVRGLYGYV